MSEKIKMEGMAGLIEIKADEFIALHDFMATVLNTAQDLAKKSEDFGKRLTMEECAGRVLVVTMMEMDKYVQQNPDAIEEMLVSKHLEESRRNSASDAMYG